MRSIQKSAAANDVEVDPIRNERERVANGFAVSRTRGRKDVYKLREHPGP